MTTLDLDPPLKDKPTPSASLTTSIFTGFLFVPPKVATDAEAGTAAALIVLLGITCSLTIFSFSALLQEGRTAAILLKAASVGAKTVAAGIFFKASTRPRSPTIPTKIENLASPAATSTRFLQGFL